VGTIHNGEISEIVDKGATVEFGEDIVAFIPTRLKKEDGKKLKGESADFKVIEFNKEFKELLPLTLLSSVKKRKKCESCYFILIHLQTQLLYFRDGNVLAALKAKMERKRKK
jgi:small subunit ribosomal protein S1